MRLDKFLSDCGLGSRRDIKNLIKTGSVKVDDVTAKDPGMQVDPGISRVDVNGEPVVYQRFSYIMMNKPLGVVTAVSDSRDKTVMDLMGDPVPKDLSPVGRLDKDTVGLLLLTNDGPLAHRLLSPKSHVKKIYFATVFSAERYMDETDVAAFEEGIVLSDHTCLPATLQIVNKRDQFITDVHITICEGKFHQVKRMCGARGFDVVYLKRISMGGLALDESLPEGAYRPLTGEELESLRRTNL